MKNIIPFLLLLLPISLIFGLNSLFRHANHESVSNYNVSLIVAGIVAVAGGYILEGYARKMTDLISFQKNKHLERDENEIKKVIIRVFTYLIIGLLFSFYFLDSGLNRTSKMNNCIIKSDTKEDIQECIESANSSTQIESIDN